jgi:hypothetical protein
MLVSIRLLLRGAIFFNVAKKSNDFNLYCATLLNFKFCVALRGNNALKQRPFTDP